MEVSLSFGAGRKFGGSWVRREQRSKVLAQASIEVEGPGVFDADLPFYGELHIQHRFEGMRDPEAPDENQIVAVVAGRIAGDGIEPGTLVDLTETAVGNHLKWKNAGRSKSG